jgi:late competence protein required for DNA uptake (superfamily II DNA/RNA helicase)
MVENKKELKCFQCNKIYTTKSFIKECNHHFCEECIYFWINNSFSDYLFEKYPSFLKKQSKPYTFVKTN